jgi:hypothetical protein
MSEARSSYRLGIALVTAAAIAWSTAPFIERRPTVHVPGADQGARTTALPQ